MRLLYLILIAALLLIFTGCLSEGTLSWTEWYVTTGSPHEALSSAVVFAEVDAFASRHGFVKGPTTDLERERVNPLTGKPSRLDMHRYLFSFEPAARRSSDVIWLQAYRLQPSKLSFVIFGDSSKRNWTFIVELRSEFIREFSARYGAEHISEQYIR